MPRKSNNLQNTISNDYDAADTVDTTDTAEQAKPIKSSFDELPKDHPLFDLARRIWEGAEKFDAFHAVKPDGTHLFVDIQRAAPLNALPAPLIAHSKLQTGQLTTMPDVGRMADWSAKAAGFNEHDVDFEFNDGTHSLFIKKFMIARLKAAIKAENTIHKAGFADKTNAKCVILLPFPIEDSILEQRYLC